MVENEKPELLLGAPGATIIMCVPPVPDRPRIDKRQAEYCTNLYGKTGVQSSIICRLYHVFSLIS